jgi:hypothetical protein
MNKRTEAMTHFHLVIAILFLHVNLDAGDGYRCLGFSFIELA